MPRSAVVPLSRLLFTVAFIIRLSATASAQVSGSAGHPDESRIVSYSTAPNTGIVIFHVFGEKNGTHLNRQALIKLVNLANQTATWQPTGDNSQGVFTDVAYGEYDAEVSAVGYLGSHQPLKVVSTQMTQEHDIVLHRDPSAVNLDIADSILSPQVRKETKRAISALKSGDLKNAQKYLDMAHSAAPSDPSVEFLLGYLYFQKRDFIQAAAHLGTSTILNPRNPQALTLLGRSGLENKDYPVARSALEKAVLADPENWLPHDLLADTYLHEKEYTKAREQARISIAKGNTTASPAQLVLGEALVNLGQTKEGLQALNTFLQESPQQPMASQVRNLVAELTEVHDASAPGSTELPNSTKVAGVDPLSVLPPPKLSVKAWQPPGVDEVKPNLAPNVACPTQQVIEQSGKRVEELVDDVTKFAAVEDLFHQALDEYGTPVRTEFRKYNYVASITEPQPGFLAVDEYRAEKLSLEGYPDRIASTGFAVLALVFHPDMRDSFEMICEGEGDWRGQATWLVHFRQRDDRPNHMHSYKVGNRYYPVKLKGRAWITTDKFQIVRMEAEMVNPMPEIQLLSEHQVVEYGPIPFGKKNVTLWLPKTAEIYFDFRKHRYYRRHSFDHYMLFSIDSNEKRKEPTAPKDSKPS